MEFRKVALFGANGNIGNAILHALMACKERSFDILCIISPKSELKYFGDRRAIMVRKLDLATATEEEIAKVLDGIDVVLNALGGTILRRQQCIQNAAAMAGVKRFYPSEFGMHHIPVLPGHGPFLHPLWAEKIPLLREAMQHPAVKSGKMTYTVIGCGELYDPPTETTLCPWLRTDPDEYVIHVVGDPDARLDFVSRHDVAAFVVSSLCHPEASENQVFGFRGDHISFSEVADLLRSHSGKPVRLNVIPFEDAVQGVKNPSSIPKELKEGSAFPPDFLMLLRYIEGRGDFFRPPGQFHDGLFPNSQGVPIAKYFESLFASDV
ncbi:hypothetical protein Asppvi_010154 [Aspergillus pseudoviridinutans]|uniref:NmrA-like domain-containing protein n=1 Tax=Aspergillus pseudoviridinutans TaxID=1517512 RepID=A0A9P3BIX7_9EURO|nr:uncharacterized protein Asppvi_010154 [Aspergillus pseudoviridinutans]GIJ91189.1 hypothetical protein Asppvi_010154 [Aspergillus pseudoviridinutans]